MERHKMYELYDYTDGYGIVDYYDTMDEVMEAAEEWKIDTDGDCDLHIRKWDDDLEMYLPINENKLPFPDDDFDVPF